MKITRDEALPFTIEERTEWLKKETEHNQNNVAKLWTEINDLDAIRKNANKVPEIVTKQDIMSGELDAETIKYIKRFVTTI